MHLPQASKLAQSPTFSMKYALTPLDLTQLLILHTLLAILIHALQSCLWSCASLYCALIIQGLTVLVLQQELIQEPLIAGSTLPTADCLSQDGCNNSSHPTHSSYLATDIPPTKKAHLCSLLLNLRKAMTTAETRPCDFWGQDRKDNSAATQFSQKALF